MSWNCLGEVGATVLAQGLKKNKSLDVLLLNGCRIGDQGAIAISSATRKHPTLQLLMVEDNQIGATGTTAVSEAFRCNHNLDCMGLSWNAVSEVGILAIGEGISHTCYLYLDHCHLGNLGAMLLSHALVGNSSVIELNLGDNEIGFEGARALARAMEQNCTIETLLLGGNKITEPGAHFFRNTLSERNMTLTALELDYSYHNVQQEVNVYVAMNSSGRRLALNNTFPLALWSTVLAKTNPNQSLLYCFLREKPEVFR
jgi:Ran GTPase-activating protein (RanGAP) involved in mRNA processing and transport